MCFRFRESRSRNVHYLDLDSYKQARLRSNVNMPIDSLHTTFYFLTIATFIISFIRWSNITFRNIADLNHQIKVQAHENPRRLQFGKKMTDQSQTVFVRSIIRGRYSHTYLLALLRIWKMKFLSWNFISRSTKLRDKITKPINWRKVNNP